MKQEENLYDYRCLVSISFFISDIYIYILFFSRGIDRVTHRWVSNANIGKREEEMKSGLCLTKMNRWERKKKKKNDIQAVVNKFLA